jgi:hypothetical protein
MPPEPPPNADPESVRRANLRRESSVKSVGQLCDLVAFFSLLGTLEFVLFAKGVLTQPPEMKAVASPELIRLAFWILAFAFLLNTIGQVALGYGLKHLQAWARWTVVALTAISLLSHVGLSLAACAAYPIQGLLGLVIGGAIHGLILYPLVNPGSGVVFSASYKEIIRQTPEIRSRMHWLLKLLIGLILAGVVGFLAFLGTIYFRIID